MPPQGIALPPPPRETPAAPHHTHASLYNSSCRGVPAPTLLLLFYTTTVQRAPHGDFCNFQEATKFLYFPRGPQAGPWGTGQDAVGQDRGNHSFPSPSSVDINNIHNRVGWVGLEWTPDDTEYEQSITLQSNVVWLRLSLMVLGITLGIHDVPPLTTSQVQ